MRFGVMAAGKTLLAKITRPGVAGVVRRRRLFSLITDRMDKPVLWVASPAGAGKTKLISGYLDFFKIPGIWYSCDEGDSDPATFFYYMGLAATKAATRYKSPLPLLTPDYLAGISVFTRRYFEKLYNRLIARRSQSPAGFFIVLDNYQDVPSAAPFHDMIADGFDGIPEGIHIVVISRSEPPAAFARLQANDQINFLEYNDIRFTFEESKELLSTRLPRLDEASIRAVHNRTEGWAAGIILMLERTRLAATGAKPASEIANNRIFDYFAGEIFDKTPQDIREFLLKTAFLPTLDVSQTVTLTGNSQAGRILSILSHHNYFTERLSGSGYDYRYHPLFRDFLQSKVKALYSADKVTEIRRESALLLEQTGQIEYAARLYCDAGEALYLARMVVHHARDLLRQGRNKTLAEWIAAIPVAETENNPWLSYWAGRCSFPSDMPRARENLEKAFSLFGAVSDTAGLYLAWAGIVDTYAFELDDWKHLDQCIEVFEGLRRTYPSFPSRETDLIASSRMLISLILRKTDRPQWVRQWLARVFDLLQENPSDDIQLDILFFVSIYHLWKGEYHKNIILLKKAQAGSMIYKSSPLTGIHIKLMKGIHFWVTAQYDAALKILSEGFDDAGSSGVHVFDSLLWSFTAASQMASGNMKQAEKSLASQMACAHDGGKTLDIFFYHINAAWHALLKGDQSLAVEHLETIAARAQKMGTPYYQALWHIGMAQALFGQEAAKAKLHISKALQISRNMKSQVLEWYGLLIDAWMHLEEGAEKKGSASLGRALLLGRKNGYVHLEFYQPSVMQLLCAKALNEGIEKDYVKNLIKTLRLLPPVCCHAASLCFIPEDWPYPVKIFTLGKFEILRDDKPLADAGKVQKKPLEMLKIIIAEGGVDVPVHRVTEALWPDADGDLAHKSFEMTLSRLRRLMGEEDVIRHSAGQLSIDPLYCRVDSLDLGRIIGEIRKSAGDRALLLSEKAIRLYRGPFLPSDSALPRIAHRREMLRNSLLRIIIMVGRHYEQARDWEKAVEYYIKGLDTDHLSEEACQRLMICYSQLGRNADAVRAYLLCRSALADQLGIQPSPETEAIYSSIIQNK